MCVAVSVIVPVFNNPAGIRSGLEALVNQTYPRDKYEIIVADNGSTDETRQVVAGFQTEGPPAVKLLVEEKTRGSYAARNCGIRKADGEILAFTDSDCVPSREWIEAGVEGLMRERAPCGGGRVKFTYKGRQPNAFEYYDSARKLDQQSYVKQGFAATANFFVRKDLLERHGLFRSDLISGGDYEFGRRVTGQGEKLVYIPDALVCHPARSTFCAIYEKSKRVAVGQRQLVRLGLYDRSPSLRQVLPAKSWPMDRDWGDSLTAANKLQLILLQSFFRWLNLAVRLW